MAKTIITSEVSEGETIIVGGTDEFTSQSTMATEDEICTVEAYAPMFQGQSAHKTSYLNFAPACFFFIIWATLLVFVLIMMWKITKAFEKIANCFERGIFIQKQEVKKSQTN